MSGASDAGSQRAPAMRRWRILRRRRRSALSWRHVMRQVNRRRAMLAAIATVTLLIGGTVGAVAASQHFAYQKIRSGLPSGIPKLKVTSTDLTAHRPIPQPFWGCTDPGVSPQISWSGAPASTQSFAIFSSTPMLRPAAGTGTGWHGTSHPIRRHFPPTPCYRPGPSTVRTTEARSATADPAHPRATACTTTRSPSWP